MFGSYPSLLVTVMMILELSVDVIIFTITDKKNMLT